MEKTVESKYTHVQNHLANFIFNEKNDLFDFGGQKTVFGNVKIEGVEYPKFINEFWTSRQRQANSLHELAYRACFKPQVPNFFINLLTSPGDVVYDPFSGRGTTIIEAALLGRNIIANDINPLSSILSHSRLFVPEISLLEERLFSIPFNESVKADIDLSMFYHPKTEAEIVSLKKYLRERHDTGKEDEVDSWIRMVATNRLTGHSTGFFSVYTLPPNLAVSQESQRKINKARDQKPEYRDTRKIILKKTKNLTNDCTVQLIKRLKEIGRKAVFLTEDARNTKQIKEGTVQLTVTSPPFLDVVQYANDNWLRCWFNSIDMVPIAGKITMSRKIEDWCEVMGGVMEELFRVTKPKGNVAFEVGEVRGGKIRLEDQVVPLGLKAGFCFEGIMINEQEFTKTANIWGVSNNKKGTNTNRIVIFSKA